MPELPEFKYYRKRQVAEMRPYIPGEDLSNVSVNENDRNAYGSPKAGDMICRNTKDANDMWLVEAQFFADNYEEVRP